MAYRTRPSFDRQDRLIASNKVAYGYSMSSARNQITAPNTSTYMETETCQCPKGKRLFYENKGDFIHDGCGLSMRQDILDHYTGSAPKEEGNKN